MFRARAIARDELNRVLHRDPTESEVSDHAGNILNRYSGMGQEPPRVHWSKAVAETRSSGRYEGMPTEEEEGEIPERPEPWSESDLIREHAAAVRTLRELTALSNASPNRWRTYDNQINDLRSDYIQRLEGRGFRSPTAAAHWAKVEDVASLPFNPSETSAPVSPRGWGSIDSETSGQRSAVSTDVIPPISSERRSQLNQLWQDVSKQDEAFKFGLPKNGTPEAVAANYSTRSNPLKMTYRGGEDEPTGIRIENKRTGGHIDIKGLRMNRPYIEATEAGSEGEKSGGGSQMYQAAFSWAAMNGVTLHGGTLTSINAMRRTSNMLSSALRHETTEHFTPGGSQNVDWVEPGEGYNVDTTGNPTDWHTPETAYEHNVAELARAESNMAHNRIPELGKIHYDFDKNVFLSDSDKPLSDTDIEEIIKKRDPRFEKGVGLATAKRAIVTASALEKRAPEPGELVVPTIQSPRGPGSPFARILYLPSGRENVSRPTMERMGVPLPMAPIPAIQPGSEQTKK